MTCWTRSWCLMVIFGSQKMTSMSTPMLLGVPGSLAQSKLLYNLFIVPIFEILKSHRKICLSDYGIGRSVYLFGLELSNKPHRFNEALILGKWYIWVLA